MARTVMLGRASTRSWWFVVPVVAVLALASGCGDDESAEDQVCDARSELRDDLDNAAADVSDANFGEASDDLSEARDAYDELADAVGELAQEQREALAPQVDALESDIAALQDAESLDDLSAGLDTVVSQAESIFDEITDTLNCD
jgi:predicted  nucleic acid-binding Zn-ribbon protein